jgi:ligand-binding SRPBCC domain-containing protein
MLGIKTTWVTEITHIKEHEYFVDEQRVGPYKIWHHQHHLEKTENGTLMTDIVSYQPPFGFLGDIANSIIIIDEAHNIERVAEDVASFDLNINSFYSIFAEIQNLIQHIEAKPKDMSS